MKKTKTNGNDLFTTLSYSHYQIVTDGLVKGHVLHCKRAPFTMQKGIFYNAKGRLLQCKRRPFKSRYVICFTKRDSYVLFDP